MGHPLSAATEESAAATHAYGLKRHILSPIETLAQSISTIAPTATPTLTVPLVFALAGNGTWLAYVFATTAVLLVALCISRFARYSSSPGSLYGYATFASRSWSGPIAAWALLLAYVATGASVTGGFINYANVLLHSLTGRALSPVFLAFVAVAISGWIAYRDVKISTRLMLWIEAVSVCLIGTVLLILLCRKGVQPDWSQLGLHGASPSGVRLGLVLALFSFVGFESATTLGAEAKEPLRTIPRALIQSALLAGLFFILCAYTQVLGFRSAGQDLGQSNAPFRVLAIQAGVPLLGPMIDVGALVSMFACALGCITAAARVLMMMAHSGFAHSRLSKTHKHNATPAEAVIVVGAMVLLPVVGLAIRGVSGFDIYGWMGSLATYGFLTVYAQVAIALPFFLARKGHLTRPAVVLSIAAALAMVMALVGTLYPVPAAPYNFLPYLYLGYLLAGLMLSAICRRTVQAIPA